MEIATAGTATQAESPFQTFNPPSLKFAKRAARRLQRACYELDGIAIKLSKAQEATARAYGYNDWFTLVRQIERKGYSPSILDSKSDELLGNTRAEHQRVALSSFLRLQPRSAADILSAAQITASQALIEAADNRENGTVTPSTNLPLAGPRPGLTEILLTAYPLSAATSAPLPGWKHYVVVAAPTDNTALWVGFCEEESVAVEAQKLVRTIKALSGGMLALAHIPSQVLTVAPQLRDGLKACEVEVGGGRPAIVAARLRARLDSVLVFIQFQLSDTEAAPSSNELQSLLNGVDGLVEIPDSKNLGYGNYDERRPRFARELMKAVRTRRWPSISETQIESRPVRKERRREFWREKDGSIKFGSGVQPIAKGSPVYRIRIDLNLVEPDFKGGTRKVTVSRVIDVPVYYSLWDLHVAIQDAMGWADYHLHEFTFYAASTGRKTVSFCSPNEDDPDEPCSVNERLADHVIALASRPGNYRYDFGDGWDHRLTLLGSVPSDGGGYPRCISGERACPPEDCGSASGYFRILDLMAGGSAAENAAIDAGMSQKEMRDWLKSHVNVTWPYRPDQFDPATVEFDDPRERWDYAYGDVVTDD